MVVFISLRLRHAAGCMSEVVTSSMRRKASSGMEKRREKIDAMIDLLMSLWSLRLLKA